MQDLHEDSPQIVKKNMGPHSMGVNRRNMRFIVSGVSDQNFIEVDRKVQDLGGSIFKTDKFVCVINNVLACNFNTCEKILGALASGYWILKMEYVTDSSKAGYWLNREDYEWDSCGEIAKYCRHRKKMKGQGMFAGWRVYIHLESRRRKSFSRIICGGGGKVYTREELRRKSPDFVLVEKKFVEEARALVGSNVPLVNTNFISETLFMKRDPQDIKPYIINTKENAGNEAEGSLTDDVQQDNACVRGPDIRRVDNSLLLPEGSKGQVTRNYEKASPSKQACVDKLFSKSKMPVKSRSRSPGESPRKTKKKLKFSTEKYMDIRDFCVMKDSNAKRSECIDSDDSDIVIVSEEPSGLIHGRENSSVINVQDVKARIKKSKRGRTGPLGFLDKKTEEKENVYRPSVITREGSESSEHSSRVNDISGINVLPDLEELPSLCGTNDERVTNSINKTHISQNQMPENHYEKTVKGLSNLYLNTSLSNENNVEDRSHKKYYKIEKVQMKEMSASKCLRGNDTDADHQSDEPSNSSLLSSSSSGGLHFNSDDIKNAVMTLLKKHKMSCSTLTTLIQPCYPERSELAFVVIDDQESEPEEVCTEICYEETAFFDESTDEDVIGANVLGTTDEETIVDGIESLFLHICIRNYPPAWVMARILSQLALKVDSEFVHQEAMNLAYQVLTLNPPNSTKRRAYYYRILTLGMQADADHHNRAWIFVQDVVKSALTLKVVGGETSNEARRACELLQFLLTLLQQDFLMWDRRCHNVLSLITVQLLWGSSGNLKYITQNIKDLMQLWVESINSTPDVQSCLGVLMSILLEVVVAGTNIFVVDGDQIFLTSYIHQIITYIQHLDMNLKMKLMASISSPWVRWLVFRNLLCKLHSESSHELSGIDLKALLYKAEKVEFVIGAEAEETVCQTNDGKSKKSSSTVKERKNINKRNTKGETQLVRACITNNIAVVKNCLATPGVDVNLPDNAGWTALHEAALRGHVQCVKLLLEFTPPSTSSTAVGTVQRVNLHTKADGDYTALHDAVENDHHEVAKLLLEHGGGALLNAKTSEGKTPFGFAKSSTMTRLLKSYIRKNSFSNSSSIVDPRREKYSMPVHVAIQKEDYGKLLVAAVNSYVTHMGLMSVYRYLYAIAKGETSNTGNDCVLLEEQKVVEKLFPIIQSDLRVVCNSKPFLCTIDLPKAKNLLKFSLSR